MRRRLATVQWRHLVNGNVAAARSGEWAQHFSNASCSKKILLRDKDRHVQFVCCEPWEKSAIYDFLVRQLSAWISFTADVFRGVATGVYRYIYPPKSVYLTNFYVVTGRRFSL